MKMLPLIVAVQWEYVILQDLFLHTYVWDKCCETLITLVPFASSAIFSAFALLFG